MKSSELKGQPGFSTSAFQKETGAFRENVEDITDFVTMSSRKYSKGFGEGSGEGGGSQ